MNTDFDEELEELKATVLRPLADKFQELARQIDGGEYKKPKTLEEAEKITENYIQQAYDRLEALINKKSIEARKAELLNIKNFVATDGNWHDIEADINERLAQLSLQEESK